MTAIIIFLIWAILDKDETRARGWPHIPTSLGQRTLFWFTIILIIGGVYLIGYHQASNTVDIQKAIDSGGLQLDR